MSFADATESDILLLLFNATAISLVADNAGTTPITAVKVALHTGSPADTGDMTTSEATYTSYARVSVNRNSGGWTIASGNVQNAAQIAFPAATGGSNTITHFSVGYPTGDEIIFWGALDASLAVSSGVTPAFAAGACQADLD
jgi:hypothetical protein